MPAIVAFPSRVIVYSTFDRSKGVRLTHLMHIYVDDPRLIRYRGYSGAGLSRQSNLPLMFPLKYRAIESALEKDGRRERILHPNPPTVVRRLVRECPPLLGFSAY